MQLSPHWSIGRCTVEGIQKELSPPPLFSWCSEQSLTGDEDLSFKSSTFKLPAKNWGLNYISMRYFLTHLFTLLSHTSPNILLWLPGSVDNVKDRHVGVGHSYIPGAFPDLDRSTQTWTEAFVQIKSCGMTDLKALWESRLWEEEKLSGASRQSVTFYTWGASLAGC